MSWSLQVLNGLETVLRAYDFADHVVERIIQGTQGVESPWMHTRQSNNDAVSIPQWWQWWFEPEDAKVVDKGATRLAELRKKGVNPDTAVVGLLQVCFWRDRRTDRTPPGLPPVLLCGRGTVHFHEWGTSQAHRDYFTELARKLNDLRVDWPEGGPSGRLGAGHTTLGDDFAWLPPRTLESLTDAEAINKLAGEFSDHLNALVS